jgi:phosphoserine aminotransferase
MGLMFTSVEREQLGTLAKWIAESRETSWLAANRRRSQRVLMKVPVRITGQVGAASKFVEETHTLAISAHGALLVVAAPVYRGQRFSLLNLQTKAALECVVAHIDKFPDEQIHVGVEFMLPNPTFWRVAFPPKDWTPRHPDAKSQYSQ